MFRHRIKLIQTGIIRDFHEADYGELDTYFKKDAFAVTGGYKSDLWVIKVPADWGSPQIAQYLYEQVTGGNKEVHLHYVDWLAQQSSLGPSIDAIKNVVAQRRKFQLAVLKEAGEFAELALKTGLSINVGGSFVVAFAEVLSQLEKDDPDYAAAVKVAGLEVLFHLPIVGGVIGGAINRLSFKVPLVSEAGTKFTGELVLRTANPKTARALPKGFRKGQVNRAGLINWQLNAENWKQNQRLVKGLLQAHGKEFKGVKALANKVNGRIVESRISSRTPSHWDQILGNDYLFRSVDDLSQWETLRAHLRTIIPQIKLSAAKVVKGKDGLIQYTFKGNLEKARKVLADLTVVTRREVALLVLPGGRQIIRLGSKKSVSAHGASKIIAHSHPNGFLMLSERMVLGEAADDVQLAARGQVETFLVGPAGDLVKWRSPSAQWVDDVIGQILVGGQ